MKKDTNNSNHICKTSNRIWIHSNLPNPIKAYNKYKTREMLIMTNKLNQFKILNNNNNNNNKNNNNKVARNSRLKMVKLNRRKRKKGREIKEVEKEGKQMPRKN